MNDRGRKSRTRKKTYVIIDEFGDVQSYSKKEPSFGYGVTVTDDLEPYNSLSVERRKKEREKTHRKVYEIKARDDSLWNKTLMAVRIRASVPKQDHTTSTRRALPLDGKTDPRRTKGEIPPPEEMRHVTRF